MAESPGLTEEIESDSASAEQPITNPDTPIYGIRWPANRLTSAQMNRLRQIRKDVWLPITQLLKDAVDVYLMVLQREMQAMMVAEPQRQLELFESDLVDDEATKSEQVVAEAADSDSSDENCSTG